MAHPGKDPENFRPFIAFKGAVRAVAGAANAAVDAGLIDADDIEIRSEHGMVVVFGNPALRRSRGHQTLLGFLRGFAEAKGAKYEDLG